MEIRFCQNKNEWDQWFAAHNHSEFLQSWNWGEFQRGAGKEPWRLRLTDGERIAFQFQGFIHQPVSVLRYLYVPRPHCLAAEGLAVHWKLFFSFFKKQKLPFVRWEPGHPDVHSGPVKHSDEIKAVSTKNIQAHTTMLLDLALTEEELLKRMHPKTRYNIHLAERKGVKIKMEKNIEIYWRLCQETKERDKFETHAKKYYEKMLELDNVAQLTAYYEGEPLVSNICVMFGDTCTYLHGASSNKERNLMAPYLAQWEAIKLAKKSGYKYYDFWGVAPKMEESAAGKKTCFHNFCWPPDHRYTGFTRFKAGFGGFYKEYPGAVDVVLKPVSYGLYKFVRALKRR